MSGVLHWSMACVLGMCLVGERTAVAQATAPHSRELWRLVAQSHLIAVGVPQVPAEAIRSSQASKKPEYVLIEVACEEALKGTPQQSAQVHFYTSGDRTPTPERVIAMDRKRAVFFLISASQAKRQGFFLADHTPDALSEADPKFIAQVQAEVQEQRTLLEHFPALFPSKEEPLFAKVKDLIDAATRKGMQEKAFADLEALGPTAVPPIIMLMDDRRELPEMAISLKNPVGHWEGLRHYTPETVTDAMAAILNQITGESFGFIYNGGTEQERREAVNAWRIYLCHDKKKTETRKDVGR